MTNVPVIHPGLSWFAALPDSAAGTALAAALQGSAPVLRQVDHPSGRPFMVGRWTDGEAAVAALGDYRLVVLGEHRLGPPDLLRLGADARDAAGLCAAVSQAPGSFHVLASTPDGVELHGTLSGFRRLFFGSAGSVTVASDRADLVAALTGAAVDEERLATRLLSPGAPWPLFWQSVWRGVQSVRPDERLVLAAGSAPRTVPRWRPPEATLSLADAGERLRRALSDAVRVRTEAGGIVASDLSGMDSTALCCLAAGTGAGVVALTCVSPDPLDDDLPWATQVVRALDITHEVIPVEQYHPPYEAMFDGHEHFDEPTAAVMYRAGFLALSDRAAAHGARLRFSGFGGDELLTADPALQLTLLGTQPRTAMRQLRQLRGALRWSRRDVLRAVLDRRTYGEWLGSLGRELETATISPNQPILGWGPPVRVAPWVTPDAVMTLRRVLAEHAPRARPLTDDGGTHGRLVNVYLGATMNRHMAQMTRRTGVPLAVPYFDDHVLEACLSARLADITDPWEYKPLISEAMRGIVPDPLLARRSKADTTIAAEQSAVDHRDALLALAENSRLAERGLVDAAGLHAAIRSPTDRTWFDLDQTLACETWLRAIDTVPT